ncbi:MAG: hypothetical protein NC393_13735 [Clostridium sp.]|nr:hypothetical protein [Clostridium sp.]MCM1208670.1 hypothetical protein [Ruminococcus sp.]
MLDSIFDCIYYVRDVGEQSAFDITYAATALMALWAELSRLRKKRAYRK